jgi:pilus assembly protein CpaC
MRQGDTLAVAGLIQQNYGADASRVPFFGDLPVLGRLFGREHTTAAEQELIILITPVLVHPVDCKSWRPLPGGDMFEPNSAEFYLHGRLESNHPVDYRSPIRSDLPRQADYRTFSQPSIVPPYQGYVPTSPYSVGGAQTPTSPTTSTPINPQPTPPPTLWQRFWHRP